MFFPSVTEVTIFPMVYVINLQVTFGASNIFRLPQYLSVCLHDYLFSLNCQYPSTRIFLQLPNSSSSAHFDLLPPICFPQIVRYRMTFSKYRYNHVTLIFKTHQQVHTIFLIKTKFLNPACQSLVLSGLWQVFFNTYHHLLIICLLQTVWLSFRALDSTLCSLLKDLCSGFLFCSEHSLLPQTHLCLLHASSPNSLQLLCKLLAYEKIFLEPSILS